MYTILNLFHAAKFIRVSGPVVAGTTNLATTAVDMAGYDSIGWLVEWGTHTSGAVTSLKAREGTDSTPTDAADLAGSGFVVPDTSSDTDILYGPLVQPTKRWVQLYISRGTQNVVINGVYAILYNARNQPVTQPAGMVLAPAAYLLKPAEGTA